MTEKPPDLPHPVSKFVLVSARAEVPVTTLPGLEEEPEAPARKEVVSEVEHMFASFPFLEVDLYRYVM